MDFTKETVDREEKGEISNDNVAMESLGKYLTSQYGILRRVFYFLSAIDLENCKGVCLAWKEAAIIAVKGRKRIQCVTINKPEEEPFLLSDAQISVTFSARQIKSNKCALLSKEQHTFLAAYGVISLIQDLKPIYRRHRLELPLSPRSYLHATVRFPETDGVCIHTIKYEREAIDDADIESALSAMPDGSPIKAVILIHFEDSDQDDESNITLLKVMEVMQSRHEEFAFAGCILEDEQRLDQSFIQLILFGGPNVEAASCVLTKSCRSQNDINTRVEQFSKQITQTPNSALLVFRCCDRHKVRRKYNYLPKENVETWESNAFKLFFPSTSAIGCYSAGEIGADFPDREPTTSKRQKGSLLYSFSTVLLYIAFKNKE